MRRGWARLTERRLAGGAGTAGARSCCPSCAAEMSKHPAGGRDGRGPLESWRVLRCLGSESPGLRSPALVPRPRLRGLYFSSFPLPRETTKTSPEPGPESLQQRWKPPSVDFDVGGWGLARRLWGASKGAAFRPVRASNLEYRSDSQRSPLRSLFALASRSGGIRAQPTRAGIAPATAAGPELLRQKGQCHCSSGLGTWRAHAPASLLGHAAPE